MYLRTLLCCTAIVALVVPACPVCAQRLQPHDADMDWDEDQCDWVQVLQAGKYLTGEPATWGEGDWDGAPGGEPGNPPPGDGVFNQLDIIHHAEIYLTGPYHGGVSRPCVGLAIVLDGVLGDGQTSIVYDPATGEVAVDAPTDAQLTSLNVESATDSFVRAGVDFTVFSGSYDNVAANNLFKATFGRSFGSISFGNVAPPGLAHDAVLNDLSVIGSLDGGGGLGPVDLVFLHELSPGDANRDFVFDQQDIVQVLQAGKYLTGEAATWGEGDWDGGPGGYPGKPPPGDSIFDQQDIVAALQTGNYLNGSYAAMRPGGTRGDEQTSIIYDARTGEIAIDAPASNQLTSINIDSDAGIFANRPVPYDVDPRYNIFEAKFGHAFGSVSFGKVAQLGLSEDSIVNDLTVVGSLGDGLGDVDLIYIPEPYSLVLVTMGFAGLLVVGWRRSTWSRSVPTCLVCVVMTLGNHLAMAQVQPELQAGDADMDLDFDQFDLILALQADKYLTGQYATWGEGDWNGAPGGSPGNPPPGNGLFDQADIIASLAAPDQNSLNLIPPDNLSSRIVPHSEWDDDNASLGYDADTGLVWIEPPPGEELTSISITSQPDVFTGDRPQNLAGTFDAFGPVSWAWGPYDPVCSIIFKATLGSSFGSQDFGNAAKPDLGLDSLLNDWYVAGSRAGGGGLGDVNLIYVRDLLPGDANQDFSFDQLDIVQVMQAGKYLTGEPATWGEGDWDGAPGGYPGEPPIGDVVFDQKDIVVALQTGLYLQQGPSLQAGDANMDLEFNQLDLVQVQIAAKYRTGQSATWGEGDWNGAPGGFPGNPPPGDGVFDQLDIIAALRTVHCHCEWGCGWGDPYGPACYARAPAAVPEPASMALLVLGMVAFTTRGLMRRKVERCIHGVLIFSKNCVR